MKFKKRIILLVALVPASGMNAAGWLDSLLGTEQTTQTAPAQQEVDWSNLFSGGQKPAAAPTQLGLPAAGSVPAQSATVDTVRQNIVTMIAKVQEMAPAITTAITNKDFTSIAKLAEPAKDILTLGMSTAKNIQQAVVTNPELKGVFAGLINQLNTAITPMAAQIRSMSETAGWGKSFVLRTIAAGLEQVPQLLNQAAQ